MAERAAQSFGMVLIENRTSASKEYARVFHGDKTTRATLRAEVGTAGAEGSLYLSSAGKLYVKAAAAGADTDWEKVTQTAAD